MVCANCALKESKKSTSALACIDPKLNSATASSGSSSSSSAAAGPQRKLNENKLLSSKNRYAPYAAKAGKVDAAAKCKLCRVSVRAGRIYCQSKQHSPLILYRTPFLMFVSVGCSYKQGVCAMCGVEVLSTKGYKMSSK
jgi:hypothetical protein